MGNKLTVEITQTVHKQIMEVLKKNNLPITVNIGDAVLSLLKEVSCQVQSRNYK